MIGTPINDPVGDHEEEHNTVCTILQSLPRIEAREDFDVRLQQRLTQGKSKSVRDFLSLPRRIPVYALTLIAGVAVGVLAYNSFIRTDVAPQQVAPKQENPQRQQPTVPTPSLAPSVKSSETQQPLQATRAMPVRRPRPESSSTVISTPESVQDELNRGMLKEVGGTGARSAQRPVDMPFLEVKPQGSGFSWTDSIARADSLKRDSLKRFLEHQQKIPK